MHRRAFVLASLLAGGLRADDRADALEAIAPLASALSNSDAGYLDDRSLRDLPNRGELRDSITALIAQAEVTSSVEIARVDSGSADLDWYMEIRSRATRMIVERRRREVQIRFRGNRLQSIAPLSFFAPGSAR